MTEPVLRIVPGEANGNGVSGTYGTKVLLPDGTELPMVTKIVLTAEVNDVWRAEIHCYVRMEPISAESRIFRVVPDGYAEVTAMRDTDRQYVRVGAPYDDLPE